MRANNIAIKRTIGLALVVFIAWAILSGRMAGMFSAIDGESPRITYATYADMIADGAMLRGWIPDFVPESATNFEECHNLDTNHSWLRFSVPPEDIDVMAKALSPVSISEVVLPRTPPAIAAPWWPEALTAKSAKTDSFQFFRFNYFSNVGGVQRPEHDFVAVESSTNTIWHWRP